MKPEKIRKICRKLEDGVAVFFKDEISARNSMEYFSHFYPELRFVTLTNTCAIFPSFESMVFFYYNLVREEPPRMFRDTIKSDINILLEDILLQLKYL